METYIYSVKVKSQAGNIVKDIMTTQKDQIPKKITQGS